MDMPIFISKLPFPIKVEGNQTSEFYFSDNVEQFIIKFEQFTTKLKVHLSGNYGDKSEYFIEKNDELISKSLYSIIRFVNTNNEIIEITLDNYI